MTSSTKDGKTTSYTYAGADMNKLLTQTTTGGAEYHYTYGTDDGNGVPVITSRELVGTGTASVVTDPSTGQPLDLQTTDGVTSMYVLDGIGNLNASIANTGDLAFQVSYDPYGAENVTRGDTTQQWQQNPYGFKAGLRSGDANGLTKFGMRWQSSITGGWIQRDTLDAPLDPKNANRYAFATSDPVNGSDPSGRIYLSGADARDIGKQTVSAAANLLWSVPIEAAVSGVCAITALLGCAAASLAGAALNNAVSNATADAVFGDPVEISFV